LKYAENALYPGRPPYTPYKIISSSGVSFPVTGSTVGLIALGLLRQGLGDTVPTGNHGAHNQEEGDLLYLESRDRYTE